MSAWRVDREQWVAWIYAGPGLGPGVSASQAAGPRDGIDAHILDRLARLPFPGGVVEVPDRFESMTTLVRNAVDDEDEEALDEDDATRVRREPDLLEVGLHTPEDGLEVSLHAAGSGEPPPPLPSVAGETVVMDTPPSADEASDDGMFIPALTRTVIATTMPLPPESPPPEELAPVVSGQTVIGPPPAPPPDHEASISTSSGLITSDPEESAKTLIRGEIPAREDPYDDAVPRKSKVVIDPSASGVLSAVYDDDDDEDQEPEYTPVEVDELDADDLVEEELVDPESAPPPAPGRPPRAREPEVAPARRPSLDVGPPPPPLASASLDAALAALPAAPPLDEAWQIDAFGDHFGALVSPLRAATSAAEADFIVHCAALHPGASVLDVGCGDGSHCLALAAHGLSVTGLDLSPVQLMRASQAAQASGTALHLIAGDMRQPPVEGPYDAIVCLGGTLGLYTDEDDRIALQHMRDRLAPGGRIMLHVLNRDYIVARLPARSWWQGQGCLVLDEAQMFAPTSRVHVHRTVVFETGKQFEHNLGVRIYALTELVQMCAQVGLRVLEYSGSRHTRGRFYGATSSEIWLLAQRGD